MAFPQGCEAPEGLDLDGSVGVTARSISTAMVSSMRLPGTVKQRCCPNCTFGCSHL
jgi:hypothetical protein